MAVPHIPAGLSSFTPYLVVKRADEFAAFVKAAFDGEVTLRVPREDGKVRHGALKIGETTVEFSDGTDEWKALPFAAHLFVVDAETSFQRAVAAGATAVSPVARTHYGEMSGTILDRWGNYWFIATQVEIVDHGANAG